MSRRHRSYCSVIHCPRDFDNVCNGAYGRRPLGLFLASTETFGTFCSIYYELVWLSEAKNLSLSPPPHPPTLAIDRSLVMFFWITKYKTTIIWVDFQKVLTENWKLFVTFTTFQRRSRFIPLALPFVHNTHTRTHAHTHTHAHAHTRARAHCTYHEYDQGRL